VTAKHGYGAFPHDFRLRAITLAEEIGVTETSRRLGVPYGMMRNWVTQNAKGITMRGKKEKTPDERAAALAAAEIRRLKKENEELKKVNWILQEVAKVFSKDQLDSDLRRSLNSPAKGPKK
jgi:transposase-like protein